MRRLSSRNRRHSSSSSEYPAAMKPAIAREERQFFRERPPETIDQHTMLAKPVSRVSQHLWQGHKAGFA